MYSGPVTIFALQYLEYCTLYTVSECKCAVHIVFKWSTPGVDFILKKARALF